MPGTLTEAAALYRDDLLAGFFLPDSESFETWATQRQRLRRQAQDALSQLAGHVWNTGDYDFAAAFARRQIEIDSLDEPAHRQLMTALALSGNATLPLRTTANCANSWTTNWRPSQTPKLSRC